MNENDEPPRWVVGVILRSFSQRRRAGRKVIRFGAMISWAENKGEKSRNRKT